MEAFAEACSDAEVIANDFAEATEASPVTVPHGIREGMTHGEPWRGAMVTWVGRLYAALQASSDAFENESKVEKERSLGNPRAPGYAY